VALISYYAYKFTVLSRADGTGWASDCQLAARFFSGGVSQLREQGGVSAAAGSLKRTGRRKYRDVCHGMAPGERVRFVDRHRVTRQHRRHLMRSGPVSVCGTV